MSTLEQQDTKPAKTDDQDRDRFSHYVPSDKLADAMIFGTPLKALCGKMWVPHRNPDNFPVCPECKDAWEKLEED